MLLLNKMSLKDGLLVTIRLVVGESRKYIEFLLVENIEEEPLQSLGQIGEYCDVKDITCCCLGDLLASRLTPDKRNSKYKGCGLLLTGGLVPYDR